MSIADRVTDQFDIEVDCLDITECISAAEETIQMMQERLDGFKADLKRAHS